MARWRQTYAGLAVPKKQQRLDIYQPRTQVANYFNPLGYPLLYRLLIADGRGSHITPDEQQCSACTLFTCESCRWHNSHALQALNVNLCVPRVCMLATGRRGGGGGGGSLKTR